MNYFVLIKLSYVFPAERAGFEPAVPFWSTHTFQACSLNHSDISPIGFRLCLPLEIVAKSTYFFNWTNKYFVFFLQQNLQIAE